MYAEYLVCHISGETLKVLIKGQNCHYTIWIAQHLTIMVIQFMTDSAHAWGVEEQYNVLLFGTDIYVLHFIRHQGIRQSNWMSC